MGMEMEMEMETETELGRQRGREELDSSRLRLLDIRRMDLYSSGWETFYVKRAVQDWIQDSSLNLGECLLSRRRLRLRLRLALCPQPALRSARLA